MSDFRPRSNSELLDAAFEIYRRHFLVLMAISVFAAIPAVLASYVAANAISAATALSPASLLNGLLFRFVGLLISPFTTGAVACAVSAAYLGNDVELGSVLRATFAHPWRLFITMMAVGLLIGFGLILFIVPGLVFYKRYFSVLMVVLFEDRRLGDSMRRSRELAKGNGTRIFGLIGAVLVFSILVSMFLAFGLQSISSRPLQEVGRLVIYTVINPFTTIVATLLYYDIRIRKEGYDIELMTQALGVASPLAEPSV